MRQVLRIIGRELGRLLDLRRFSRAPRYGARWPITARWCAWFMVFTGALVGLAYWVGKGPPAPGHDDFWDSLTRTAIQPTVALPLAFTLLTCLAYSFRRVWLEWLGWRPGRIQVPDFSAPNITTASAAQLTIAFRDRLARMRLASSGAAPASQPETDFLDVLSVAQVSSSDVLRTLLGLLRAAVPSFAYEIRGVIVQREGTPREYRVSLQIVRLPSEGCPQVEVTDTDLDRAIRRAADAATAAILPRTRLCKGPWVAWRRYVMPGELFSDYEEACEQESGRRYDQARDLYYRALAHDPMNRMLRLQLGQLQEKLHMFLEALATYTGMIDTARPADRELPAGLYPRRAERERKRALLLARYRRAVLLGEGSFTGQWYGADGERHADLGHRRKALRDQLEPWLAQNLEAEPLALLEGASLSAAQRPLLQRSLTARATAEVEALRRDLPLAWRFRRRPPLTGRALDLAIHCIEQRAKLVDAPGDGPTPLEDLERQVNRVERWRLSHPRPKFQRWEEQYNAACLFAIPLLTETPHPAQAELAKHAVNRLELAAACADSSFIAHRRDWVTTEDPDLDGLRRLPVFKAFEAQYFPSAVPIARRPKRVLELAELRCTRDLLAAAARGWEAAWRGRAATLRAGEHQGGVRWWSDEHEVWRRIHDVALNHNSRARLALTNATHEWHVSYSIEPVEPMFERYEEHAIGKSDHKVDDMAAEEIKRIHDSLLQLTKLLSRPSETHSYRGLTRGFSALDVFDAEPTAFTPAIRGRFCRRQAAVWRRLHEWLVPAEGTDAEALRRSLERELRRARWLWRWTTVTVWLHRLLRGELRVR